MSNLVNLRTENFLLRELKNCDKEDLLYMLKDPDIKKYIPGLSFNNLKEVEHLFILSKLNNSLLLIIEDISCKKAIGMIFAYIDSSYFASISYVLHTNQRGKGIMPEALKLFLRHLYNNNLAISANFYINNNNKSSLRVMKKLNIPYYNNHFRLSLTKELPF